jgi:pimeloyl-ACP methyl ester carboxylesterase
LRTSVLLAAVLLAGCAAIVPRYVAGQIEHPARPGHAQVLLERKIARHYIGFQRAHARLANGLTLVYWYSAARAFDIHQHEQHGLHSASWSFKEPVMPLAPYLLPARLPGKGTVLLLPGWSMDALLMSSWAITFAQSGYRVVMLDLPDQGGSSQAPPGFGPAEAADLSALVPQLELAGAIHYPLYLFGVSYGADVALFAADRLARPPAGVIALEPFANAASAIRRTPDSGLFIPPWLAHLLVTHAEMDAAIDRADRVLGLDLYTLSPRPALAHASACVLIVRGSRDQLIGGRGLARMVRGLPRVQLLTARTYDHLSLPFAAQGFGAEFAHWMSSVARQPTGHCPAFGHHRDYPPFLLPAATATRAPWLARDFDWRFNGALAVSQVRVNGRSSAL